MKMKLQKVFFCTGARNHDLLKILDRFDLKFEFDERMASFKALGLSKVSKDPVAICTTSGTAVSQAVSAMLEAYYSQLPLILITGDRPKKMHGTGAPQTIEHESLTRSCRRTYLEVELNELENLELKSLEFPIHINVLVDDTITHALETKFHDSLDAFKEFLRGKKKPLFLFSHENQSMRPFIEKFKTRNLLFYAETLSGGRDLSLLKTEKKLQELFNAGFFDSVIRVGYTPLTKIWRLLERSLFPVFHFDSRNIPALSYGDTLALSSQELLTKDSFWGMLDSLSPYPIGDETVWTLDELVLKYPESEISYFNKINEFLAPSSTVYLGNSLAIRFFELTQKKILNVHGNRGVNGIDGQLASAIGLAMGTKDTVYCILGDITTLYDLSSLREMPSNLKLIIINNKGDRIFDMLNLDKRIVLEHSEDFKDLAYCFKLSYSNELKDLSSVQVLELSPDRGESEAFLREWQK